MPLPITAIFAGLNALLLFLLATRVIGYRRTKQVAFGDKGDPGLQRVMRGHANAAEYIPLSLILLGLTEGMGAPAWIVLALGAALFLGRLSHAYAFWRERGIETHLRYRVIGMHLTFWPILLAAVGLIGHGALTLLGAV